MLIDTEQLAQRENWKEPREWRTFQLTPSQKCRFLVKGINSKGYRIAQEREAERGEEVAGGDPHRTPRLLSAAASV